MELQIYIPRVTELSCSGPFGNYFLKYNVLLVSAWGAVKTKYGAFATQPRPVDLAHLVGTLRDTSVTNRSPPRLAITGPPDTRGSGGNQNAQYLKYEVDYGSNIVVSSLKQTHK